MSIAVAIATRYSTRLVSPRKRCGWHSKGSASRSAGAAMTDHGKPYLLARQVFWHKNCGSMPIRLRPNWR